MYIINLIKFLVVVYLSIIFYYKVFHDVVYQYIFFKLYMIPVDYYHYFDYHIQSILYIFIYSF